MANIKHKILLIEDDVSLVRMYSIKLKRENFEVFSAINGTQALDILKNIKPNLILLDIMLPDISGLEILKQIKNNNELKDIPIIIFTVLPEIIALKKALELGADTYLIKNETTPEALVKYIKLELKRKNGENKNKNIIN